MVANPGLPDFGGVLQPSEVELLLQYLTVPYLRIPLVLEFFTSSMDRVYALQSPQLRELLEGALFEPGEFMARYPATELKVPSEVKVPA